MSILIHSESKLGDLNQIFGVPSRLHLDPDYTVRRESILGSDAGFLGGTIFFFFELCGRFHRHAPKADKVKALSPHHRLVIALHSPDGVGETGLRVCPAEKNTAKLGYGAKQDTFSGPVSGRESQNCADFQRFLGECSLVSLQPRLHGGGRSLALTSLQRIPW
jgi:hypothetical protein